MKAIIFLLVFLTVNIVHAQHVKRFRKVTRVFAQVEICSSDGDYITVSVGRRCKNPFAKYDENRGCHRVLVAHLDSERTRDLADYGGVLQEFDLGDISVNQVSELDYRDDILFVILGYSDEPLRYCSESQTPINRDYYLSYTFNGEKFVQVFL